MEFPQPKPSGIFLGIDGNQIQVDVDQLSAFGSQSREFACGILRQLAAMLANGDVPEHADMSFAVDAVAAIAPRDEVEGMLAAQMVATHHSAMTFARRLANAQTPAREAAAESAFNCMTRIYAMQVETLKLYRQVPESNQEKS